MSDDPKRKLPRSHRESWPAMDDFFSVSPFSLMRKVAAESGPSYHGFGEPWPALEVSRQGDRIIVCAELPGVDRDDVRLEATEGGLVIEGEKRREEIGSEGEFLHAERTFGYFRRIVSLPEGCDVDRAQAAFRDGLLRIEIPAPRVPLRNRRISID